MDKKEKSNLLGRILASIFVTVCFVCLSAVVIALALKFIFWLY